MALSTPLGMQTPSLPQPPGGRCLGGWTLGDLVERLTRQSGTSSIDPMALLQGTIVGEDTIF